MSPHAFMCCILAVAVASFDARPSHAGIVIPSGRSIGPVPSVPGNGLDGAVYAYPDPFDTLRTLADADAFIAANDPVGRFVATTIDYPRPGNGSDSLGDLLGPDAASLDPVSLASGSTLPVYRFQGGIAITADFDMDPTTSSIEVEFSLMSDDASRLRLGGIDVIRAAGDDPSDERGVFEAWLNRAVVSFESPGLYPVDLVWWNWYGGVQLHWYGSIPSDPRPDAPPGLSGIVPTSVLYRTSAVPEPSTLLVASVGLFSLVFASRRGALARA